MQVFEQRSSDGLFLKTVDTWVREKRDARDFVNCTPATDFCIEHELQGVRLYVAFENPKYDFSMEVFRTETRALVRQNRELREQQRELMAKLDSISAETKERKKQFPFKRESVAPDEDEPEPAA